MLTFQTPEDADDDQDMVDDDSEDDSGYSTLLRVTFILSYFPVEDYVDYDTDHEARPKTGEVDPYAGKCPCTTVVYVHLWHNRYFLFQGTPGGGH